ncbi:Tad domain-containing protein [Rhodovulum sp. BSW8]|uniref:Tad domain-containing protein n=1 Tax=Rhodovulum sp. BSW8 TaxID=2259645 RepID=UPI0014034E49|nr:Tad domain-containing protein [Rhodovulum sp. BSW8]
MQDRCRGILRSAGTRLCGFGGDERGALVVFFLFVFVGMLIAGGMAVDFLRADEERTRLQATLDRAVLAAANLDSRQDPEALVHDYFRREGLEDHIRDVQVHSDLNGRVVGATASFDIHTLFLQFTGIDTLSSGASGVAREHIPNSEISLVLDISGSMRWDSRMAKMRPAAKDFIHSVLNPEDPTRVSINLIPYAGQTNPGPVLFEYLGGQWRNGVGNFFEEWPQDISHMTTDFDTDGDGVPDTVVKVDEFPDSGQPNHVSNDPDDFFPEMVKFIRSSVPAVASATVIGARVKGGIQTTQYYAVEGNANGEAPDTDPLAASGGGKANSEPKADYTLMWNDFDHEAILRPASCLELGSGEFTQSGLPSNGPYEQTPLFMYWTIDRSVMDWGWCPEDDTAIQYAQNDEAVLDAFVDAIRMHDGTGTHYAMKYALGLLDPSANAAFRHLQTEGLVPADFADRPAAWDDAETAKYIVLMTDGAITEQYRPTNPDAAVNATVELEKQSGSKRRKTTTDVQNVASFYETCTLAKKNGVVIFTIAYMASSAAKQQMQTCASTPLYFFDTTPDNIGEAFSAIAGKINKLRLIQ